MLCLHMRKEGFIKHYQFCILFCFTSTVVSLWLDMHTITMSLSHTDSKQKVCELNHKLKAHLN